MLPNRFIKPLSIFSSGLHACLDPFGSPILGDLQMSFQVTSNASTLEHSYADTIFKENAISDFAIEIAPSDWQCAIG